MAENTSPKIVQHKRFTPLEKQRAGNNLNRETGKLVPGKQKYTQGRLSNLKQAYIQQQEVREQQMRNSSQGATGKPAGNKTQMAGTIQTEAEKMGKWLLYCGTEWGKWGTGVEQGTE